MDREPRTCPEVPDEEGAVEEAAGKAVPPGGVGQCQDRGGAPVDGRRGLSWERGQKIELASSWMQKRAASKRYRKRKFRNAW